MAMRRALDQLGELPPHQLVQGAPQERQRRSGLRCARKNRSISAVASGPAGSV